MIGRNPPKIGLPSEASFCYQGPSMIEVDAKLRLTSAISTAKQLLLRTQEIVTNYQAATSAKVSRVVVPGHRSRETMQSEGGDF